MTEQQSQMTLFELAKNTIPPSGSMAALAQEITREYWKTGRISTAKVNMILGDQTKAATMPMNNGNSPDGDKK